MRHDWRKEYLNASKDAMEFAAENKRLWAAIIWVLGEGPDSDGLWFGQHPEPPMRAKYWWRKRLRELVKPKQSA